MCAIERIRTRPSEFAENIVVFSVRSQEILVLTDRCDPRVVGELSHRFLAEQDFRVSS